MRHATDSDHVVAVSTIVSRTRSIRSALPIGVLWGIGHSLTIVIAGAVIAWCGASVAERLGATGELAVAAMLVVLGVMNLRGSNARPRNRGRPFFVGVVHGLAGSAPLALVALAALHDALGIALYLVLFGAGTIAGMALVTVALAAPIALTARRFERFHRALGVAAGLTSVAWGIALGIHIASHT